MQSSDSTYPIKNKFLGGCPARRDTVVVCQAIYPSNPKNQEKPTALERNKTLEIFKTSRISAKLDTINNNTMSSV